MENELKSLARARKIGGSLVITIPVEIVKEEQIEEGELLEFAIKKSRKSYFGIAKGVKSFTREDRMKDRF